jgi:hypothetical protein
MDQNTEITSQLIDILNNRRRRENNNTNNTNNRNYTSYTRNERYNRNRNNPSNETQTNNNGRQRRVYIDNIPYSLDNLQLFTIPLSNVNTNTNTTTGNHFSRLLNSFLEPVNITPTQTQIENATRNIIYGDILDPINNSCPISLEAFTDTSNVTMIRHCRHIFNTNSLISWFNTNCKCPVCRYDIRNYNPNNTQDHNQESQQSQETQQPHDEQQGEETVNQNEPNNLNSNTSNIHSNNNSIENLFVEILNDLSNNDIDYTFDNTSQLFNSLFSINRRRESRR